MATYSLMAIHLGLDWMASAGTSSASSPEMVLIPCLLRPVFFSFEEIADLTRQVTEIRAIVFLFALIVATATDLRNGKIYNWLTLPLMLFALACAAISEWNSAVIVPGDEPGGALNHAITGGLVCFGLMFLYYVTSGGGGGDVKLATAVGFGFGAEAGLQVIALAYVMAWSGVTSFRLVLGMANRMKSNHTCEPSHLRREKREIRMAPWFLVAMLPVLAGIPVL